MDTVIIGVLFLGYLGTIYYLANRLEVGRVAAAKRPLILTARRGDYHYDTAVAVNVARMSAGPSIGARPSSSRRLLNLLLYGTLAVMFLLALSTLLQAGTGNLGELEVEIDFSSALANFVAAAVFASVGGGVIASRAVRQWIGRCIGSTGSYDPDSMVHTTAIVLSFALLSTSLSQFVLGGGLSGLAQDFQESGVSLGAAGFGAAVEVAAAFLGVGLVLRRGLRQSLERLKLTWPTWDDVGKGAAVGFGLYLLAIVIGGIWITLVSPEQFEEQSAAAEEMVDAITTLPIAFAIAALAAFGEEILFRGALQPVFGLFPVAIFFTVLHTQVLLTPGMLVLLAVALGLGWIREKRNTTAAIFAHFVYNFTLLALGILAAGSGG